MADDSKKYFCLSEMLPILKSLAAPEAACTLIAGQAVNYWAQRFLPEEPALRKISAEIAFSSKDIDFYGSRQAAQCLARHLGQRAEIPSFRDSFGNLLSGIIRTKLGNHSLNIEILWRVPGLEGVNIDRLTMVESLGGQTFRVLEPISMLYAKAWNVRHIKKEGRRDAEQLMILLVCVRAFLKELLGQSQARIIPIRRVLAAIERTLAFAESNVNARKATEKCGIDWQHVIPLAEIESSQEPEIISLREQRLPLWRTKIAKFKRGLPQTPVQQRILGIIAESSQSAASIKAPIKKRKSKSP